MNKSFKVKSQVHFRSQGRGSRKKLKLGGNPTRDIPAGRVPRIARYMALAIRYERLIGEGVLTDYAEIARLMNVTRARVTQVMNLRLLAPDIQEKLLMLPRRESGRDAIKMRDLQAIVLEADWEVQRRMFGSPFADSNNSIR